MRKILLNPSRVRRIGGSFAFIEHRFLRDGFLETMEQEELLVYLFFVLASDEKGLSYYSSSKICRALSINPLDYQSLLERLLARDLIVYDHNELIQVLSLPQIPIRLQDSALEKEGLC
tara:strand:+ start:528 stop:881 length:354 start_codon:yes stop_codon:yes gene_type:complete